MDTMKVKAHSNEVFWMSRLQGSAFGDMDAPLDITSISCSGTEADLTSCAIVDSGTCSSGHYASISCSETPFSVTGLCFIRWQRSRLGWQVRRSFLTLLDLVGHYKCTTPDRTQSCVLGDSGGVVNSLDFCPASLKSLGCFYFRCVLSSQWKAVTVNLRILHCQL